jgi:hypothetical protein
VNPLRTLLRRLTRDADEEERARAGAAGLKALRQDIQTFRREMTAVAARFEDVSRQLARIRLLQHGSGQMAAVFDELAALMAPDGVRSHVRAAVEGATYVDEPSPRLLIDAIWPRDVYAALVEAIPDPVFFEGPAAGARTLRVPPRLAPAPAIATWTLVADIVGDVVAPAVAARFNHLRKRITPALDVAPGRLVRHPAGANARAPVARPSHWGLLVIDLSRPNEEPRAANTAVAFFTPAGAYVPSAPEAGVRCRYEVSFGDERSQPA